ncbi:hypothetical protein F4806DRAFT_505517 [Annulohypoxylon nitens]|nr:hypothetical protein F4806DRAFT_505517 [Annulohypoxylon nitens]
MTTHIVGKGWVALGECVRSSLRQKDAETLMSCPDIVTQEAAWSIISASLTGVQLQSRIRGLIQSQAELCNDISALNNTVTVINLEFSVRRILWSSLICTIQYKRCIAEKYVDLVAKLQQPMTRIHTLAKSRTIMTSKVTGAIEEAISCIAAFLCNSFKFFSLRRSDEIALRFWKRLEDAGEKTVHDIDQTLLPIQDEVQTREQCRTHSQITEITEILKRLDTGQRQTPSLPQNSLHMLPFPQNPRFFGRGTQLSQIDKLLEINHGSLSAQKSVALYGIGGVGKTQIALQYAYMNSTSWPIILWVSAVSRVQLAEEFHVIAVKAGLVTNQWGNVESARKLVLDWLSSLEQKWLLIFDNVNEEEELREYWPSGCRGSIIMTMRNPSLARATAMLSIEIEPFNTTEGSAFLFSLLSKVPGPHRSDHDSEAISDRLGGLPLALNQMAALMSSRAMSLAEFRKMYEKQNQKYNSIIKPGSTFYYKYTINNTWELSLSKLSGNSKALLQVLSFFDPDGIPVEVLRPLESDANTRFRTGIPNEDEEISEAMGGLMEAALMKRVDGMDSYVMHRLVKETTYKNMDRMECLKTYEVAVYLANSVFPKQNAGTLMVEYWPKCERYLRQVITLVTHYKELRQELTPLSDLAELISNAAWYMDERGLGHHALDLIEVGLENCGPAKTLIKAHLHNTAGTIYSIQNKSDFALEELYIKPRIYTTRGEHEEALSMHLKAVEIRQQPHETQNITLGQSLGNIAHCHHLNGQSEAAKETIQESIDLWEGHYGRHSMPVAKLLYLEGNIYCAAGDLDGALKAHNEALEIRIDILGQHEATAASHYKIACILEQQGEYADAEDHLRLSIEACGNDKAIAGSRARGIYRRATVLFKLGKDEEANTMKIEAGKLRESVFGICLDERDSQEDYDSFVWLNYR